ncbi:hypothetical protein ACLOJK_022608 [Asimina triloba]
MLLLSLQCQSMIDELSASHSTDLQQRAYELQAVMGLDTHTVENIMPADASCEDIEIDESLSFLNNYVQRSLEKGARPYIPENERSGMVNVSNFRNQDQHEVSVHTLRFEAYELPKPSLPANPAPLPSTHTTDLVPMADSTYTKETYQAVSESSVSDVAPTDLGAKLRLDGVQKKWGRPSYSTPAPSASTSTQKTSNGTAHVDGLVTSSARDISYDSRRQQVEVSAEKKKLAASLFGGVSSKSEKRPSSGHKASKVSNAANEEKARTTTPITSQSTEKAAAPQPPPDLLDMGEPVPVAAPSVDPFTQLEGLISSTPSPSSITSGTVAASVPADLMAELYADASSSGQSSSNANLASSDIFAANVKSGLSSTTNKNIAKQPAQMKKGPNAQDSLEKDAVARQVGVTPSSQNPNLFRDLLG